jgi:hypothetical protein
MISVHSGVNVYEFSGEKVPPGNYVLHVEAHWNCDRMVILQFKDLRISVSATDLLEAIKNATNSNRHG